MGSRDLTVGVETPEEVFDTAVEISEDILDTMVANIKLALLTLVIAVSYSSGSPAPHRLRRAPQEQATRLFTGNSAIDAGAAGAALGAAAQFIVLGCLHVCGHLNFRGSFSLQFFISRFLFFAFYFS